MKLLKLLIIAIILIIAGIFIYMNTAFKNDAAAYASNITGTNVSISAVTISPFAGTVSLHGLDVGNPNGFKADNAIEFGSIYANINLASLLTNKIIVNEVKLDDADIYYEMGVNGDNIRKLISNVKSSISSNKKPSADKKKKDLIIKNLHVTNSELVLAADLFGLKEDTEIEISDIHLTDIGTKKSSLIAKQIGDQILRDISQAVIKQKAQGYVDKLGDKVNESIGGNINNKLKDLF